MTIRKISLLFTALATITATAIACSGGGGGGTPGAEGELTSGIYELAETDITLDECGILENFQDGAEFTVIVTAGTISALGLEGAYDEGLFDIELVEELDLNEQGLDCVLEGTFTLPGRATADNVFEATLGQNYTVVSGADCGDLGITFPCTSSVDFVGNRLRDLPPPPTPITGVLNTASGFLATATVGAIGAVGTDLQYNVSFGSGPALVTTNDEWICYLPEPPSYPNYDLFLGADFEISISVTPSSWTVGPHAINGSSVTMSVDFGDRLGDATGGFFNIISAPTTTTGTCAFSMANVPLAGEQDPPAFAPSKLKPTVGVGKIGPERSTRKQIRPR